MTLRIGTDTAGWIDLPAARDITATLTEIGGQFRGVTGRLNADRVAVKRTWQIPLRPYLDQAVWGQLQDLYLTSPGPYFFMDGTAPNLLPDGLAAGVGWMSSAGVLVPDQRNMRVPVSATYSSVQSAKSSAPAVAELWPVTPGQAYTFGLSLAASSFAGTLAVYTYAGPSGSGTSAGSTALAAAGRYGVTFTPGAGQVYAAARITRTSGAAEVSDFGLRPGSVARPNIFQVRMDPPERVVHDAGGRVSTLTITLQEV